MSKSKPVGRRTRKKVDPQIIVALIGLVGVLVVGFLQFGPEPPESTTSKEYVGRVLNADTQKPIPSAKISLDLEGVPPIVYTDSEGVFRFKVAIASSVSGRVNIEAPGYQLYSRIISISPDNLILEDLRLTPIAPTSTPQPGSTSTFTPEPTATMTHTPTITPTATNTPLVVKPLAEGCVFSGTWKIDSTDSTILNNVSTRNDGCYDTGALGIFADRNGVLRILDEDNRRSISSGIFTPVNNDSVIEFQVKVNLMYLVNSGNPAYINFAVAPAAEPMNTRSTARFKLQLEDVGNDPWIYFVLADVGENNGSSLTTQHYEYGRTYTIRLELTGSVMRVYINNIRQNENLAIPTGSKVFYIGYNLPTLAGVDVEVTNVKIDGVLK